MVIELQEAKDDKQPDCDGMMVLFDDDEDVEPLEWTEEEEEEEDDLFYDERCADSELKKIYAWLAI